MTKEEFNNIWKDTSRENILNQFYYDYMYMKKLKEDINKAIEYIEGHTLDEQDEDGTIYKTIYTESSKLLEILKGDNDE